MKEKRAKELMEIERPRSIERILRFLDDLGLSLDTPEEPPVIGRAGFAASQFAFRIATKTIGSESLVETLMNRNQLAVTDVLEFNLWLRKFSAKRAETEVLTEDDLFLLKETVDDAPTYSRRRSTSATTSLHTVTEESDIQPKRTISQGEMRKGAKPVKQPDTLPDFPTALSGFNRNLWLSNMVFGAGAMGIIGGQALAADRFPGMAPMNGDLSLAINQFNYYGAPSYTYGGFPMVGGMALQSLGRSPTMPQRDLMSSMQLTPRPTFADGNLSAPIPASPLLGQVTLIAPPVTVASKDLEKKGAAVSFNWNALKGNVTQLDTAGLQALKESLPEGAKALYPALPEQALGPSAVNLPLAPEVIRVLLDQGYGHNQPGLAETSASLGFATSSAMPLLGDLIPWGRPMGGGTAIFDPSTPSQRWGSLSDVGGMSRRGGILDFLGMPIRLAPSLRGRAELRDEMDARGDMSQMQPVVIRPNVFSGFRDKVVPRASSVTAEPNRRAWAKAGSDFGIQRPTPARVLSPMARAKPVTAAVTMPQTSVARPQVKAVVPATPSASAAPIKAPTMPSLQPQISTPSHATPTPPPSPISMPKPAVHIPHQLPALPQPPAAMMAHPEIAKPKRPVHLHPEMHAHPRADHPVAATPKMPLIQPAPVHPATAHISHVVSKPAMPLAKKEDEHGHLAVQASRDPIPTPSQEGADKKASSAQGAGSSKDSEIHLLANEVWSILKSKLAFEAERSGRA